MFFINNPFIFYGVIYGRKGVLVGLKSTINGLNSVFNPSKPLIFGLQKGSTAYIALTIKETGVLWYMNVEELESLKKDR
jgi:cell division protein FtsX